MQRKNDVSTLRYARTFERLQLRTSGFNDLRSKNTFTLDTESFLKIFVSLAISWHGVCSYRTWQLWQSGGEPNWAGLATYVHACYVTSI